jgi:hypothetical protein
VNPLAQLPPFEALVALHAKDPAAYEEFRRQLLHSCIHSAPEVHRPGLELLRERMDQARAEATTPIEAATAAFRLMVDSCSRLRAAMVPLAEASAGLQTTVLLSRFRL